MGSFYDLDYIIEMNEERLEQYSNAYQKTIDKFTNILVLYSAFAIFLIPMIQSLYFSAAKCYWLYYISFYVFIILFTVSLINTIRLLMPVEVAHLRQPKVYYKEYMPVFETGSIEEQEIDALLKESYVNELEEAIDANNEIVKRKKSFYFNAFIFALLSSIPYVFCIGFQLSIKIESINNFSTFNKTQYMAKHSNKINVEDLPRGVERTISGVDPKLVIRSSPEYITEGIQLNLLWDNDIVNFIKDFIKKIFRRR